MGLPATRIVTDEEVRSVLTFPDAVEAIERAFRQFGQGEGAVQDRVRTLVQNCSLSMMGAVLPEAGVMGTKIYSTVGGRFDFLLTLHSTETGYLLGVLQGNALTEFRTAAVTVLAARYLAPPAADRLAIFGTGTQAAAHLAAFVSCRKIRHVLVVGRDGAPAFAEQMTKRHGIPAFSVPAEAALAESDIVVTATRSPTPLFPGRLVTPGTFIAAVGSSKPAAREIDDELLGRAHRLVVEWKPQAMREAGDLVLAKPGLVDWDRVEELGAIVARKPVPPTDDRAISLFKSVGIGLEDVALAHLALRRLQTSSKAGQGSKRADECGG